MILRRNLYAQTDLETSNKFMDFNHTNTNSKQSHNIHMIRMNTSISKPLNVICIAICSIVLCFDVCCWCRLLIHEFNLDEYQLTKIHPFHNHHLLFISILISVLQQWTNLVRMCNSNFAYMFRLWLLNYDQLDHTGHSYSIISFIVCCHEDVL